MADFKDPKDTIMSKAEEAARSQSSGLFNVSEEEKLAKAQAERYKQLQRETEQLQTQYKYLKDKLSVMKDISTEAQSYIKTLEETIALREKDLNTLKDLRGVQAELDAESLKASADRLELENDIADTRKSESDSSSSGSDDGDRPKKKPKKKKDDDEDEEEDSSTKSKAGSSASGIVDSIEHISRIVDGTEETNSAFSDIGKKLEATGNPILATVGKGLEIVGTISDCVMAMRSSLNQMVDNYVNVTSEYYGKMNAALEGSGETSDAILKTVNNMFGGSALVKQEKYLANIADMATKGIAFNVEQRALLNAIRDKALPSFNAMEDSLTSLVRLKKTDVSQPFFGMENVLKKTLNSVFQDSTYLQNLYDSVNGILINSSVQQSAQGVTAYNSTVQTWLGSMYEAGVSDSVIQSVAQAIDALGSGNVQKLSGNTQAQNLLLLSMDSIGMDYADILQNGLTAGTTNDLLKAMVDYLAQIANSTEDNKVLGSAYANLFSFTMADIEGIQNLAGKAGQIYNNATTTYSEAMQEFASTIANIDNNYMMAEKIDNWTANAKWDLGSNIADSDAEYLSWKMSNWYMDLYSSLDQKYGKNGMNAKNWKVAKAALMPGKAIAEGVIIGETADAVLHTIGSILGEGLSQLIGDDVNSLDGAIDYGIVSNMYGGVDARSGYSRSAWATASRQGGGGIWDNVEKAAGGFFNNVKSGLESVVDSGFGLIGLVSKAKSLIAGDDAEKRIESQWGQEDEEDPILDALQSMMVQADEAEGHKALAVFLAGMTDSTLRSFASIFADEEALGLTTEDSNQAYKLTMFSYAEDQTNATQVASTNTTTSATTPAGVTTTGA